MADYKYSFKVEENMANAVGRGLAISTKQSIEICSHIRKWPVEKAKNFLNEVILEKRPVPMKRFNKDTGHKPGMGAGRYPVKTSKGILKIIESAEANAQFKGLNTSNLKLIHISAQAGSQNMHYGRQRGRLSKSTHIEVVVLEGKKEEKKAVKKESAKKESVKKEAEHEKKVKPETKPAETKPAETKTEEARPAEQRSEKPEVKPEVETKLEVKPEEPKVKPAEPVEEKNIDAPKEVKETPKEQPKEDTPKEQAKEEPAPKKDDAQ